MSSAWPNAIQLELITACTKSGDESLQAWKRWSKLAPFKELDHGSGRIVPFLYLKLKQEGIDPKQLTPYRGTYKYTWTKNQLLLRHAHVAIEALLKEKVSVMPLKGTALLLNVYRDSGARGMDDVDLLIPRKQVKQTIQTLETLGWSTPSKHTMKTLDAKHAFPMHHPQGGSLDIHTRMLRESPEDWQKLWESKHRLELHGLDLPAPSPTQLYFHCLAHGLRWNPIPPFRWILDLWMLQSTHEIDWLELLHIARAHQMTWTLKKGLNYLLKNDLISLPEEFKEELDEADHTGFEVTEGGAKLNSWGGLHYQWYQLYRQNQNRGVLSRAIRFPDYLAKCWELPGVLHLPFAIYKRTRQRLKNSS